MSTMASTSATGGLTLRTRLWIKRTPWLYRSAKRLTGRGAADHLCTRDSDLCIEGYPSSGNSFSFALLRFSDPDLRIAHHCHSVANLAIALSYGVPAVCLIREPTDAIASRLARFGGDVQSAVVEYIDFYRFAVRHRDRLTIVTFDEVTREPMTFLTRIERACGRRFAIADAADLDRRAREYMTRWTRRNDDVIRVSLPVAQRERDKARMYDAIVRSSRFADAQALWRVLGNS